MSSLLVYKWLSATFIFTINVILSTTLFALFRPSSASDSTNHFPRKSLASRFLQGTNAFSIGLFLAVCFLGLFNSGLAKVGRLQSSLEESSLAKHYPIGEAILCLAFLAFWIFDWLLKLTFARSNTVNSRSTAPKSTPLRVLNENGDHENNDHQTDVQESDEMLLWSRPELDDDDDCVSSNQALLPLSPSSPPHSKRRRIASSNRFKSTVDQLQHEQQDELLKALALSFGLGLHALLEAVGFGLMESRDQVVSMAVAMALHQSLCSTTLSLRLTRLGRSRGKSCLAVTCLTIYLALLPIGVLAGSTYYSQHHIDDQKHNNITHHTNNNSTMPEDLVVNSTSGHWTMAVLQLVGAAAFMFILFVDLVPGEVRPNESSSLRGKWHGLVSGGLALTGFLLIAVLRLAMQHH